MCGGCMCLCVFWGFVCTVLCVKFLKLFSYLLANINKEPTEVTVVVAFR